MSQTVSQNHAYLIRRNGIYYFSRRVPSDLQTRFNKERVTISLRTRSFKKAEKSAEALSDRLERYWDGLRLEVFHTKELGLSLVGASFWAAKRVVNRAHQFAFPVYANFTKCSANSASAALNKWLKSRVPSGCVVHSFRHSIRDRLRAVECPPDIADAIGGWPNSGVGEKYGSGHGLKAILRYLNKITMV